MKKNIISSLLIAICMVLFVTLNAHAEGSASSSPKPSKSPRPYDDLRKEKSELRTMRADQLRTMEAKRDELKTMRAEQRSAMASARAEMKAKLCERISEHLGDVVSRYQDNHQSHVEQYQKLKTKVQEIVTKLKAQGLDTKALEATLPTLDTKIKEVATQHALYIEKLNTLKTLGCNASETDLKAARDAARAQLEKVRSAVEDVRNYYKTTVRAEIIKLKTARASLSPKASPTVAASATNQ